MTLQLVPIFRTAHLELKPRTAVPRIHAEFFPFAGLTHTARFRNDQLWIRISDLFMDAPQHVIHSLALILLAKIYRRSVVGMHYNNYRSFILGTVMQERARHARPFLGKGNLQ